MIKKFKIFENNKYHEFLDIFNSSLETDIPDWIESTMSTLTKLKEYSNLKKLSKNRNFNNYIKYIENNREIKKLERELRNLENKSDELIYDASDEILYNFQKDLLEKDQYLFYKYFIKDNLEYQDDTFGVDTESEVDGIHPKILEEYNRKFFEELIGKGKKIDKIQKDASKYNL